MNSGFAVLWLNHLWIMHREMIPALGYIDKESHFHSALSLLDQYLFQFFISFCSPFWSHNAWAMDRLLQSILGSLLHWASFFHLNAHTPKEGLSCKSFLSYWMLLENIARVRSLFESYLIQWFCVMKMFFNRSTPPPQPQTPLLEVFWLFSKYA